MGKPVQNPKNVPKKGRNVDKSVTSWWDSQCVFAKELKNHGVGMDFEIVKYKEHPKFGILFAKSNEAWGNIRFDIYCTLETLEKYRKWIFDRSAQKQDPTVFGIVRQPLKTPNWKISYRSVCQNVDFCWEKNDSNVVDLFSHDNQTNTDTWGDNCVCCGKPVDYENDREFEILDSNVYKPVVLCGPCTQTNHGIQYAEQYWDTFKNG